MNIRVPHNKGFTLIEIIVSLAIFTMVAVVALGAFLRVIDANKKAQSLKTAVNNLNFVLDAITRDMKEGREFYCGATSISFPSFGRTDDIRQECTDGKIVAFRSSHYSDEAPYPDSCFLIYAYRLNTSVSTSTIQRARQQVCGDSLSSPAVWSNVTSDGIYISDAQFSVVAPADRQPRVHITLQGTAGSSARTQSDFSVQTIISPHIMNN